MQHEEMNFDVDGSLEIIEIPVTIQGTKYILREASGEAAKKYRRAALQGIEMVHNDEDGTRTTKRMQAIADVEPLLVSLCLFSKNRITNDPNSVQDHPSNYTLPVPLTTILLWPSKVQRKLFDKAKEISELDERDDLASLKKQLERLTKRIARAEEDSLKNGVKSEQSNTMGGSELEESSD